MDLAVGAEDGRLDDMAGFDIIGRWPTVARGDRVFERAKNYDVDLCTELPWSKIWVSTTSPYGKRR